VPVSIPEPFRAALEAADPGRVADEPADTPQARYARGLARLEVGRDVDARADFEAAAESLATPCGVELAYLDIRAGGGLLEAVNRLRELATAAREDLGLRARALHILGLGENQLRHTAQAADALLEALRLYRSLGDTRRQAMLHDTLGMVHAARGRLDHALHCYAMSIVDKSLSGDRRGLAISLGNLGRAQLSAGRAFDALECFERNLSLTRELGDARGEARALNDIGRAHLELDDATQAEETLREALALCAANQDPLGEAFAGKDLVLALCSLPGRLDDAEEQLRLARAALPAGSQGYITAMLDEVEGEWRLASGEAGAAIPLLEAAVSTFAAAQSPDHEVRARLTLARALVAEGAKGQAERHLSVALRISRKSGLGRFRQLLNEAMTELEIVVGAVEEARAACQDGSQGKGSDYVLRGLLGAGAFGEVHRAYDPVRGQEVAFKYLKLDRLYDVSRRESLLISARLELAAASRLRHPGVVRVYAIGTEPNGSVYVVQELVHGCPLDAFMTEGERAAPATILRCGAKIAEGLQALHEGGVVHRDLKPANVLLRDGDPATPVLVDFGIAHVDGSSWGYGEGSVVGTLDYMAPEQALGKRVDPRVDLYALGVLLFEWLAGVRPLRLRGGGISQRIRDLNKRAAPALTEFRPDLGGAVADLLASLLEKDPGRRPTSAERVADACNALAAKLELPASQVAGPYDKTQRGQTC